VAGEEVPDLAEAEVRRAVAPRDGGCRRGRVPPRAAHGDGTGVSRGAVGASTSPGPGRRRGAEERGGNEGSRSVDWRGCYCHRPPEPEALPAAAETHSCRGDGVVYGFVWDGATCQCRGKNFAEITVFQLPSGPSTHLDASILRINATTLQKLHGQFKRQAFNQCLWL